ncbi:MAG: rRNA maturation RNase YbeY [Bacteroidales bacterium]|nr:rRNA maturation RNase YbeY [Bacteroidales bacterium]
MEDADPKLKNKRLLKSWIAKVADSYGLKTGDLAYVFCSDDRILEVNKEFLQHDYYTDIITFDYCEGDTISGDMYISVDTVRSNSELFSTSFINEMHRVIIHGVLHLCGLKDKAPDDEKKMREAEAKALAMWDELVAAK